MPYIIDGHNLIPHVRGLSLQRLDDEMELVQRLQIFCRVRRQSVEVYFDKAAPGRAGSRNFGLVKAVFVVQTSNADTAIRERLKRMGKKARNWKVVSSDRQVQAEARYYLAEVVTAADFASMLEDAQTQNVKAPADGKGLSEREVADWLEVFSKRTDKKDEK